VPIVGSAAGVLLPALFALLQFDAYGPAGLMLGGLWLIAFGVGNVILPLYGVIQVVMMVLHSAGLLERMTIGEAWVRNLVSAMMCFGLSGLLRLAEFWIQNGTAGVR